jgi:hypothetical protein
MITDLIKHIIRNEYKFSNYSPSPTSFTFRNITSGRIMIPWIFATMVDSLNSGIQEAQHFESCLYTQLQADSHYINILLCSFVSRLVVTAELNLLKTINI